MLHGICDDDALHSGVSVVVVVVGVVVVGAVVGKLLFKEISGTMRDVGGR